MCYLPTAPRKPAVTPRTPMKPLFWKKLEIREIQMKSISEDRYVKMLCDFKCVAWFLMSEDHEFARQSTKY